MTWSMKFKNECHTVFHTEYLALIHIASNSMQIVCCKIEESEGLYYIHCSWESLKNWSSKIRHRHLAMCCDSTSRNFNIYDSCYQLRALTDSRHHMGAPNKFRLILLKVYTVWILRSACFFMILPPVPCLCTLPALLPFFLFLFLCLFSSVEESI